MRNEFILKLKEASFSILPIFILIYILNFSSKNVNLDSPTFNNLGPVFVSFTISIIPLIFGMTLFSLGAEKAMGQIGEIVGKNLTKRKSLTLLIIIAFLLGTLLTVAEPDLSILSSRFFTGASSYILVIVTAIGVGLLLVVAILRVIFQKSLKSWLIFAYLIVFALGCIADSSFYSIVFDAGGATTGSVSVPFIISLGVGVALVRGGKNPEDDSFGYTGLCSLGPLISVMIMSIILSNSNSLDSIYSGLIENVKSMNVTLTNYSEIGTFYLSNFTSSLIEISLSLSPIVVFFFIYQFFLKIKTKELISIIIGLLYTYIGLVLFIMGANSGFIPVASSIGAGASKMNFSLLLFLGFCIGLLIILAEPGVHVLANQVNDVSRGVISKSSIFISLGIATGLAVIFNLLRIRFNISLIYIIGPLYIVAFILSLFVPDIYLAIAFDSAGIATGSLASCFVLPLSIAYTSNVFDLYYKNLNISKGQFILENGFGVMGLISCFPILAIEIIGLTAVIKAKVKYMQALKANISEDDNQIVHLPSYQE